MLLPPIQYNFCLHTSTSVWKSKRSIRCQLLPSSARTFQALETCAHRHNDTTSRYENILQEMQCFRTSIYYFKIARKLVVSYSDRISAIYPDLPPKQTPWFNLKKGMLYLQNAISLEFITFQKSVQLKVFLSSSRWQCTCPSDSHDGSS